jgi:hypothetical protein
VPNVLRRFFAMTGRVPIIHVVDTAFTIGQGAREGQPRHDHWPPSEASQNDAASALRAVRPQARNRRSVVGWTTVDGSPSCDEGSSLADSRCPG